MATPASLDSLPTDLRHLRACLLCSLVKTLEQFELDGCDNCDDYLRIKGNRDAVFEYTAQNFDGMVALTSPPDSWVAKWLRTSKFVPGVYAVSVTGTLAPNVVRELRTKGIDYKPRDISQPSS